MLQKMLIGAFLIGYTSISIAANLNSRQNLPEMCSELSSEVINLSNHQSDDTCQGYLGRAGVMISVAGKYLENNNFQGAKNDLSMADGYFNNTITLNCEYKEKILNLKQREEAIAAQIS